MKEDIYFISWKLNAVDGFLYSQLFNSFAQERKHENEEGDEKFDSMLIDEQEEDEEMTSIETDEANRSILVFDDVIGSKIVCFSRHLFAFRFSRDLRCQYQNKCNSAEGLDIFLSNYEKVDQIYSLNAFGFINSYFSDRWQESKNKKTLLAHLWRHA